MGAKAELGLKVEEIEQITGSIRIQKINQNGPPGSSQNAMLTEPCLIRMTHDFDWKARIKAMAPDLEEVRHEGQVYYPLPKTVLPAGGGFCHGFIVLDSRTIVFGEEKTLCDKEPSKKPRQASWTADWKQVERGLFAVAYDCRDQHWLDERRQPEEDLTDASIAILLSSGSLVCGVDLSDGVRLQVFTRSPTDADAEKVADSFRKLIAEGRKELEQVAKERPNEQKIACHFAEELLRQIKMERHGVSTTFAPM